jgi:hypothetical protein
MVCIEDLMALGLSRRKVHEIALELGYDKADEYPDKVFTAFKQRLAEGSSERDPEFANAHSAAAQEYAAAAQEDLQYVQEASENRAAGLLVALDTLTMLHCATRKFNNPVLQSQVNESRQRVKQVLAGVAAFYEPTNFLAQTPLAQPQSRTGGNGLTSSMKSLNGSGKDFDLHAVEVS